MKHSKKKFLCVNGTHTAFKNAARSVIGITQGSCKIRLVITNKDSRAFAAWQHLSEGNLISACIRFDALEIKDSTSTGHILLEGYGI